MLNVGNIDIAASVSSKASASSVCTTQEITDFDIALANSLNNIAEKSNTYLKTYVSVLYVLQDGIHNRGLVNSVDINGTIKSMYVI